MSSGDFKSWEDVYKKLCGYEKDKSINEKAKVFIERAKEKAKTAKSLDSPKNAEFPRDLQGDFKKIDLILSRSDERIAERDQTEVLDTAKKLLALVVNRTAPTIDSGADRVVELDVGTTNNVGSYKIASIKKQGEVIIGTAIKVCSATNNIEEIRITAEKLIIDCFNPFSIFTEVKRFYLNVKNVEIRVSAQDFFNASMGKVEIYCNDKVRLDFNGRVSNFDNLTFSPLEEKL